MPSVREVYFYEDVASAVQGSLARLGARAAGRHEDDPLFVVDCGEDQALEIRVIADFERYSKGLFSSVVDALRDEQGRVPRCAVYFDGRSREADKVAERLASQLAIAHEGRLEVDLHVQAPVEEQAPDSDLVEHWFGAGSGPMRPVARQWFDVMRECGSDVRADMHMGSPAVFVGGAPFACVNVFSSHVSVAFFHGAGLPDPAGLLQGWGDSRRHVELRAGRPVDQAALRALIQAAYEDAKARLQTN